MSLCYYTVSITLVNLSVRHYWFHTHTNMKQLVCPESQLALMLPRKAALKIADRASI